MSGAVIEEMTWQDLNFINGKRPRWGSLRTSGFKVWFPGEGWHYGFVSYEQAEWALGGLR